MQGSDFTLDTTDGVPVHVHRWLPDDDVRGVVQIAHGLAEHGARYGPVAEVLTAAGYAVYADDHRGHGRTAASDEDLGFFAEHRGWTKVLDDLRLLNEAVKAEHPGAPAFLLGHSMGSFLAQQFLFTFPGAIDGAVLSGSNGPAGVLADIGAVVARVERLRLGSRGRSKVLHTMSFGAYNKPFEPARTEFDWLSRDPDVVDAYIADPRCGFVATTQLWIDLLGGLRVIAQPEHVDRIPKDLPIHIFSGEVDPVGGAKGVAALVDLYADAGLTRVSHRVYLDGRHEMMNEVNREEVLGDLVAWLDRTVAGL